MISWAIRERSKQEVTQKRYHRKAGKGQSIIRLLIEMAISYKSKSGKQANCGKARGDRVALLHFWDYSE